MASLSGAEAPRMPPARESVVPAARAEVQCEVKSLLRPKWGAWAGCRLGQTRRTVRKWQASQIPNSAFIVDRPVGPRRDRRAGRRGGTESGLEG